MHRDEMWQTYAPNGEPIVGEGWASALGNPEVTGADKIVGVAVVFLYRRGENGLELLWQQRSEKVDRYPGDYDISAGGHINLGETLTEAAVREVREEIGAKITADDLNLIGILPFNIHRFAWVYMVDWTGRKDEFEFDDGEVSEVRWVPFSETDEFRKKYAKAPLKNDDLIFGMVEGWFRHHGDL